MNVHLNRRMLKNHPLKEREKQRGDFGRMSSLMTDTHIYWLAMISLSILNVCVCVLSCACAMVSLAVDACSFL